MSHAALYLADVHKHFRAGLPGCEATVRALDGVSFAVERGEIVTVVGARGSGKSTLLMCAAGLMRPDRGTIRVRPAVDGLGAAYLRTIGNIAALLDAPATPPVLLIDDQPPYAPRERLLVAALLRRFAARGTAVLLAGDACPDLGPPAVRQLVLDHGVLVADSARVPDRADRVAEPRVISRSVAPVPRRV